MEGEMSGDRSHPHGGTLFQWDWVAPLMEELRERSFPRECQRLDWSCSSGSGCSWDVAPEVKRRG